MMTDSLKMIVRSSISPTSGSKKDVRLVEILTGEASLLVATKPTQPGERCVVLFGSFVRMVRVLIDDRSALASAVLSFLTPCVSGCISVICGKWVGRASMGIRIT